MFSLGRRGTAVLVSVLAPSRGFAKAKRIPAGRKARVSYEKKPEFDETTIQATLARSQKRFIKRWPAVSEIWRPIPRTPGLRHVRRLDRSLLFKGKPVKALTFGLRKSGGRNNKGRITIRFRGGGHRRKYRQIDFKREVQDLIGTIERLEYDPNRSAYIALVKYAAKQKDNLRYILATKDMEVGMQVAASRTSPPPIASGNAMCLKDLPAGTLVHNIELSPGKGGQIARSAGTFARLTGKRVRFGYVSVKMCSGEERLFLGDCMATVGVVSNPNHQNVKLGKAGRARWLGWRPRVRGVAMNPCDHPMGGGEARSKSGRPSCSKWGWTTKGRRTRDPRKKDFRIVVRRYNSPEFRLQQALKKKQIDGTETPQKMKRKQAQKAKLLALKSEMKAAARAAAAASRQQQTKSNAPPPRKASRMK